MKKLLVIARVWPEPQSSAAGWRLVQLMNILANDVERITLVSAAERSAYSHNFPGMNVEQLSIALNDSSFDELLCELQPDVVIFDRFQAEEQFGWRVRQQVPAALTILDTEDLHFLRQAREEAVKKQLDWDDALLYSETAKREIAAILRCDLSLIISGLELELLAHKMQVPAGLLHYFPLLVDKVPAKNPDFKERKDFLFIGNGLHEPNNDAIRVLKQEIWPRIRKELPEAELHIYGAYLPEKILQLDHPAQGFLVKGRAEDVTIVMQQARVFLAPLRFGAGQKGKLLEAMLHGLPSVTTAIGAEAMRGELPWPGAIQDNWDSFALEALRLYREENSWNEAASQAKTVLETCFSSHLFAVALCKKLALLYANLDKHRREHFIGQILQSNHLNTYKYLSRWIEEKNKRSV